jgi:hypothetical protein
VQRLDALDLHAAPRWWVGPIVRPHVRSDAPSSVARMERSGIRELLLVFPGLRPDGLHPGCAPTLLKRGQPGPSRRRPARRSAGG